MSGGVRLEIAKQLVSEIAEWRCRSVEFTPGVVPMASPMNQGVDAASYRAVDKASGESLWVKIPHPDARLFADPVTALDAAIHAADVGVGPQVLASDRGSGALVLQDVSTTHRVADLARLVEHRDAVIAARKRLHGGPRLSRTLSVFEHIGSLMEDARHNSVPLPEDHTWLLDNIQAAAEAISKTHVETVPAHADGNASNVMIGRDGSVILIDYDMAANIDPFEDLGSFLVEAHAFDPAARESFERFHGRFDERLFNRSRLYGVADDFRWGLIGAILAKTSPRSDLEFLKYADWRFLRCRMAMREPIYEERIRRL
jgi:thiamine kinase-like enzyme